MSIIPITYVSTDMLVIGTNEQIFLLSKINIIN